MKRWDLIIGIALVYTATITPYEVAFLDSKAGGSTHPSLPTFPIYIINVIVDLLFFADIVAPSTSYTTTISWRTGRTSRTDGR